MKKIICFGEALIDFLSDSSEEIDGISIPSFRQFPGGAPANAAVAVAKLGGEALFVGQVGQDQFGDFIQHSLVHYGVDCQFLLRHPQAPTALAFVSLDSTGDRSFSFYRQNSADILFEAQQVGSQILAGGSIFHLCSNTLTDHAIAQQTQTLIDMAKAAGVWISMDINLRHNLWPTGAADASVVKHILAQAQILKFSKEEIDYLADKHDSAAYIQQLLQQEAKLIVVTDGGEPVHCYTREMSFSLPVPKVKIVDTTCGGDGFIGGLLYQLSLTHSPQDQLTELSNLQGIVDFAIRCGAHTVARPGAFPALPRLSDLTSTSS